MGSGRPGGMPGQDVTLPPFCPVKLVSNHYRYHGEQPSKEETER
jgi:hypothetical protein